MARRDYPFNKRDVKFGTKLTTDFLTLPLLFLSDLFDNVPSSLTNKDEKTTSKTPNGTNVNSSFDAICWLFLYGMITFSILFCLYYLIFAEYDDFSGVVIFIILIILLLCLICDGGRIDESYKYLFKNKKE